MIKYEYLKETCDREKYELRMPWHDVHSRLIGPVVADIARHFVERWNFTIFRSDYGITNIKQNASVSKINNKLKESTISQEGNKTEKKPAAYNWITDKIKQINNKNEAPDSNDTKIESLIPIDEKEDEKEAEKENEKDGNIK